MGNTDFYAVTPEEQRQYNDFSLNAARQLFQPLPPVLWYYTTGSTFVRILDSKSVWATQISCLNDHSEFRYSVRLLRDEFKKDLDNPDEDFCWLACHLYETLANDGADASFFFVICMSLVRDDLSQWRGYSGGEGGVCIGFDPAKMMDPNSLKKGFILPVLYRPDQQKLLIEDIAKWTMNFFKSGLVRRPGADRKQWAESFLEVWRDQVIYFAPILKDCSFAKEEEWRLIYSLSPDDVQKVEILQRSTLISRHLPLTFEDRLPIKEIIVGPCRHPSVSRISVGTYLEAKGYSLNREGENDPNKITLSSSKIPFQTM